MPSTVANYFYHSFPRPRDGEDIYKKGLAILEGIARFGFVLAPEIIKWNQPLSDGIHRVHHTLQQRLSFTEIPRRQLKAHANAFGPFALEFEINDLRRLGAVPVFYIPQPLPDKPGISALGLSLIVQMFDAQYTLDTLHTLKTVSEAQRASVTLQTTNDQGEVEKRYSVPISALRDIIACLNHGNAPFDVMRGILFGASTLFCPTDNLLHNKQLDYYRQREWRLIGHVSHHGIPIIRKLLPEETQHLRLISPGFWDREIAGGKFRFRRFEEALIFPNFDGNHVVNFTRRIFVPASTLASARKIISDASLNIPVASLG